MCSWVYKLAAPCSELTEATAQIVMEFYILISVIVMIHKTGGEKYRYQCLLNLISACAVTIVTPLTRSQLVRRIKLTFQSLLNIKWHKIIFCEKSIICCICMNSILCSFRFTSWCRCKRFHCRGTGRPKGPLAVDSSPQYHIWWYQEVALWRHHPQQWVGADCCTLLGHVSTCLWKK